MAYDSLAATAAGIQMPTGGRRVPETRQVQGPVALHRLIAQTAIAVARADSLSDVLRIVTEDAAAIIGAHQAVTSLTDGESWAHKISHIHLSEKYARWRDYRVPPNGSGIYAMVCRQNRPARMTQAELESHPLFLRFGEEADRHPPMRGWLAAPLIGRDGKNLGLIQLSDRFEGEFDEDDEAVAVLLAQIGAAAVENVRLLSAVREREASLQAIGDLLPTCIAYLDRDERYRSVNLNYTRWFGLTPEEIVGRSMRELLGEESYRNRSAYVRQVLEGHVARFEDTMILPDGRMLDTSVVYVPDVQDGEVRGFAALIHDVSDVRAAETALRESETRYRQLADTVPVMVWTSGPEGSVNFVNEVWRDYFGMTLEESKRQGLGQLIFPDDREAAHREWVRAVSDGREFSTEYRLRRRDGVYRWHLCIGRPTVVEGEIRGWAGSVVDIDDQRNKERTLRVLVDITDATKDLRAPEEIVGTIMRRLAEHLGATRVAYSEVDEDEDSLQVIQDWSPTGASIAGRYRMSDYGEAFLESQRRGEVGVVDDVLTDSRVRDDIDHYRSLNVGAFVCCPLVKGRLVAQLIVQQSAPRRWTDHEIELIRMVADRCWSSIGRARAERVLEHSERRLRRVLEAATVGVIVNDEKGVLLYANQRLLDMLGYTVEELRAGAISWAKIEPPRGEAETQAIQQLEETQRCDPLEMTLIAKDGERIPVYVGAAVIPSDEGQNLYGAVFVTDLRQQKKVEQDLVRLNAELNERVRERTAELQEANAELEGFTYTVAHDLRAPLRAIVSTARILLDEAIEHLSPEYQKMLVRQAENAKRLAQLIDDLLSYSKLSRKVVNREPVDLSELAASVAEAVREERGNPIAVQPGMTAEADPALLRLVLFNLVDNACKFSPAGTPVEIGCAEGAFFVRDHGVGFDMAHAHKLFLPFERLVRQEEFPGTGIGLANVKRIVERHGGRIWAESMPGRGSTFWFTLG